MKLKFSLPLGSEGLIWERDANAVPEVGTFVAFEEDGQEYLIRHVIWYLTEDPFVYIVLRKS